MRMQRMKLKVFTLPSLRSSRRVQLHCLSDLAVRLLAKRSNGFELMKTNIVGYQDDLSQLCKKLGFIFVGWEYRWLMKVRKSSVLGFPTELRKEKYQSSPASFNWEENL